MKKLILILGVIFISTSAFTQGTIVDKESYIQISYPGGDTLSVSKDQITQVVQSDDIIYLLNAQPRNRPAKMAELSPSAFGFTTAGELRAHITKMAFKEYRSTFHYTSGLVDTAYYYAGDSLAFKKIYIYSGGNVTEVTAPIK